MPAISKRTTAKGESRWDATVRHPDGGRLTKTFSTRREAEAWARREEQARDEGRMADPIRGRTTCGSYFADWLCSHPRLTPTTENLYLGLWERHIGPTLGVIELRKLTPELVRRWRASLRSATSSNRIAQAYRLLHAVMATAEADELIARNPCRIKGGGREHHPERPYVGPADVLALAGAVEPRWRALILLAGFCGLRRGELAALRWSDYDLSRSALRISRSARWIDGERFEGAPKTDAGRRVVAVPGIVAEALADHAAAGYGEQGAEGLVFVGDRGGPASPLNIGKAFNSARAAIGRHDLHLHDLRHAALTMLAEEGATVRELMRAGGHASPAAALHYQRAADDRAADLAASIDARARAAAAARMATVVAFHPRSATDAVTDGGPAGTTDQAAAAP